MSLIPQVTFFYSDVLINQVSVSSSKSEIFFFSQLTYKHVKSANRVAMMSFSSVLKRDLLYSQSDKHISK